MGRRLNVVRMSILPKTFNRCSAVPVKIFAGFCVEIDKLILKVN
jgi:hypothetical protein